MVLFVKLMECYDFENWSKNSFSEMISWYCALLVEGTLLTLWVRIAKSGVIHEFCCNFDCFLKLWFTFLKSIMHRVRYLKVAFQTGSIVYWSDFKEHKMHLSALSAVFKEQPVEEYFLKRGKC